MFACVCVRARVNALISKIVFEIEMSENNKTKLALKLIDEFLSSDVSKLAFLLILNYDDLLILILIGTFYSWA